MHVVSVSYVCIENCAYGAFLQHPVLRILSQEHFAVSTVMKRKQFNSLGFSLLEMVMAAALVTGTVVPALTVIRDSMKQSRTLHRQKLLANYATRMLDHQTSHAAANWSSFSADNTVNYYSGDGHSGIRVYLDRSDDPSDGGLTGQLMNIEVTVYDDINGDLTLDAGDPQMTYRTKVAKLNSYENEE